MRNYLALAFACSLSVVAIGSPEPDRPIPDILLIGEEMHANKINLAITAYEALPEIAAIETTEGSSEFYAYSGQEAELQVDQVDLDIPDYDLSKPVEIKKGLGDEIIESTLKPRDRYKLPIWEFLPVTEPPAVFKS
jgi:hypothetical protein